MIRSRRQIRWDGRDARLALAGCVWRDCYSPACFNPRQRVPGTSTVTAGLRIESQTLSLFAQVMAVCRSSIGSEPERDCRGGDVPTGCRAAGVQSGVPARGGLLRCQVHRRDGVCVRALIGSDPEPTRWNVSTRAGRLPGRRAAGAASPRDDGAGDISRGCRRPVHRRSSRELAPEPKLGEGHHSAERQQEQVRPRHATSQVKERHHRRILHRIGRRCQDWERQPIPPPHLTRWARFRARPSSLCVRQRASLGPATVATSADKATTGSIP